MGREHWVETILANLCSITTGKRDVNEGNPDGRYPFFTCAQKPTKIDFYEFEGEAVLIAGNGFFNVKHYIGKFNAYQRTYVLQNMLVEARLVYHFLQYSLDHLTKDQRGTTIKYIRLPDLQNHTIPLPPLNEQRRIVAKLDALLPKVKHAQARLAKIPGIVKKFRQSVLAAACSGRLTEDWREGKDLPEWKEALSGTLLSFVTSGSRGWAKYYSETGALFLRIGNLDHFTVNLDLSKKQYVNPPQNSEGRRTRVQANDILISITADVGMIGLIPENFEEAYINQHISLARPNKEVYAPFLAWYLASSEGQSQFQEMQRGATKVGLGLDDIKNVKVPLPPLEEQHEIVRRVEKLFALADSLEAKYSNAMQRVAKIEQALLAKAFRGELAPPDPHDEPAEVLLQRILTEKAKLEAGPKTRQTKKKQLHR